MAATTMWTRMTRRLGFDHNPLRRRWDLIDGWLLPAAIAAFLILGPLAATAAGLWAHAGNAAVQRADKSWHQVTAELLDPVPGPLFSDNGANSWLVWSPARWVADGRTRTGQVPAPAGSGAGTTVKVWINRAGKVQAPPLTAAGAGNRILIAVAFTLAGLSAMLTAAAVAARWVLDRKRIASWEAGWLSVGPQWSRQL
ncbi:MAG TPA: hypothetical protein VMC83_33175 [Streptosporangiaceae bacterium]|nr:hypothetical protein [Streptosporangiaceae bacterium]